jgi:hypothetical protein
MARRCTTTLLMMAYLASQLAMVPHVHGASGENEPCDHNARPHIHVSWFDHAGHSRDDGHAHHHECDANHSQLPSSDSNAGRDGHDSNAVYVPNDTAVSLPGTGVILLDSLQVVSTLAIAAIPTPTANFERLADAYSPGESSPGCPLYLALRALRI